MDTKQLSGLRKKDFAKLLGIPDSEVMGEIIRLNCTAYSNALDVIRVCTLIKEHRSERRGI
jgi:hypothetical protein